MSMPGRFSGAIDSFHEFLAREGRPQRIEWLFGEDVAQIGHRTFIRVPPPAENHECTERLYDRGVKQGLGVAIEALVHTEQVTYAWVFVPSDSIDAEYRMVGGEHLKLTVPQDSLAPNEIHNPVTWWLVKLMASTSRRFQFVDLLPKRSTA